MNLSAREILDSPVFRKAQESVVQGVKDKWAKEPTQAGREALWHQLQAEEALTQRLKVLAERDAYDAATEK